MRHLKKGLRILIGHAKKKLAIGRGAGALAELVGMGSEPLYARNRRSKLGTAPDILEILLPLVPGDSEILRYFLYKL